MRQRELTKGGPAITPELDPITAESMLADADFATEHKRPTFADEPAPEGPDESVPTGHGGMDIPQILRPHYRLRHRLSPRQIDAVLAGGQIPLPAEHA